MTDITIAIDGGASVQLAGSGKATNTAPGGAYGVSVDSQPVMQPVHAVRATSSDRIARESWRTLLSFSVRRRLATQADADEFMLSHANALEGTGVVTLTTGGTDKTIPNAAALVKCESFGVQIICHYTVTGGKVADVVAP